MLHLIYSDDLKYVSECLDNQTSQKIKWITPSPQIADAVREKIHSLNCSLKIELQTINTMFKESLKLISPEKELKIYRKSEVLSSLAKIVLEDFPDTNFVRFQQVYELISNWRGLTNNLESYDLLQEDFGEDWVNVFKKIHFLYGELEFLFDEHQATLYLTGEFKQYSLDTPWPYDYVFSNFQYLNGLQLDLLISMKIRCNVYVVLPEILYNKVISNDWIDYLHGSTNKILSSEIKKIATFEIKSNYYNSYFLLEKIRAVSKEYKPNIILLAKNKLDNQDLGLVLDYETSFNILSNVWESELSYIDKILSQISNQDLNVSQAQESFKINLQQFTQKDNFRPKKIKIFELACEAIGDVIEVFGGEITLNEFHKNLILELIELNLPRIRYVQGVDTLTRFLALSEIDQIKPNSKILIIFNSGWSPGISQGSNFSLDVETKLASIAPMRKMELDLKFVQSLIINLVKNHQVEFLLPDNLIKESIIWSEILTPFMLKESSIETSDKNELKGDHFNITKKDQSSSYSASRIQTYLDCPRKYYFSYIEKIFPQIKLESNLEPKHFGTISHAVIENVLKNEQSLDMDYIQKVTYQELDLFLKTEMIQLSEEERRLSKGLIFGRSLNGINFLEQFKNTFKLPIKWQLEQPISLDKLNLKGEVDCFARDNDHVIIFDFKSSAYSSGSVSDIINFKKIQLSLYAVCCAKPTDKLTIGYIVLNQPEKSVVLSNHEDFMGGAVELGEDKILIKQLPLTELFLNDSYEKIEMSIAELSKEEFFPAKPLKAQVCDYCDLSSICLKGEN